MRCLCRPLCVMGLAATGLLLASGCGTSPRDEFIYKRQVVLRPEPGDGSRIAARSELRRPTTASLSRSVAGGERPSPGME
jgi:hypothetical protein